MTFGVTVLTAPRIYWGVLAGVLMGLAHFLYLRLHPRIIEVGLHPDGSLRDRHLWNLPPLAPRLVRAAHGRRTRFRLGQRVRARHRRVPGRRIRDIAPRVPVRAPDQPDGCHRRRSVRACARRCWPTRGIHLHISGLKLPVERVLRKAGVLAEGPLLSVYRTDAEALQAFERLSR